MDGTSRKIMTVMLLAIFAGSMLGILPIAKADVEGNFDIIQPDYVALGGPVQIDCADLETGGKFHFYLSADDDSDINSGDIFFQTVDDEDIEPVATYTLWMPTGVEAGEYYIKVTSTKAVGEDCVASDNSIEVVDDITVSLDDTEASPDALITPSGSGFDAGDDSDPTYFWDSFEGAAQVGTANIVDDGEFEDDDAFVVPHAYMGTYNVIILVTDGADTYAAAAEFSIKPKIDVAPWSDATRYSIAAETDNEQIDILGAGFPEGTVDDDSIEIVIYDMDGNRQDTVQANHPETDVDDGTGALDEGDIAFDNIDIDDIEAGVATIKIEVDGEMLTFDDAFYVSTAVGAGAFERIEDYSISATEGYNGDEDIVIAVINVPAAADITIEANGENISLDILAAAALEVTDVNGAYKFLWDIDDFPGETYSIKVTVTAAGPVEKNKNIGRFEVLPDFWVNEDSAEVGGAINLEGTGFPIDSEWTSVNIGDEEVEFLAAFVVGDDGDFAQAIAAVPHISGGGKDVDVEVIGEDMDGDDLSYTSTIVINEALTAINALNAAGAWVDATAGANWVFPGHLLQITGTGWTNGETLTVTLYDEDDDSLGTLTITTGDEADSDGDIEIYCQVPYIDELYPNGQDDVYVKVKGSVTGSESTDPFTVDDADDNNAITWLDLDADGDISDDFDVNDVVRVVGVGFEDDEYTLSVVETETDVMDVTTEYGYFDVDMTMPAMEGDPNGAIAYNLDCGGIVAGFTIGPTITLSPGNGYELTEVIVTGTGFTDGDNYDIVFEGTADYDVLDTVDGDDVDDGSFTITVTLPAAVPQQYRLIAVEEGDDAEDDLLHWDTAVFTVTDKTAQNTNKTLTEIIAMIEALDIDNLNAAVAAAQTAAASAQTTAAAATTAANSATAAANAAKTAADAATAAATAAGTKADAAATAANNAATAATSAANAANGLTTLVYAAIGASLVAAIAAIVALMQISRKIA